MFLNPVTGVLIREGDVGTATWGWTDCAKTEADASVMCWELRSTQDCGPPAGARGRREDPL